MHIIFEGVLADAVQQKYQNQSVQLKLQLANVGAFFRHTVDIDLSRAICELLDVNNHDLHIQVKSYSRSLEIAQFVRSRTRSYRRSTITVALSCMVCSSEANNSCLPAAIRHGSWSQKTSVAGLQTVKTTFSYGHQFRINTGTVCDRHTDRQTRYLQLSCALAQLSATEINDLIKNFSQCSGNKPIICLSVKYSLLTTT